MSHPDSGDDWDAVKGEWRGDQLSPLLTELLPRFAQRLDRELRADGQDDLADQLATLRIIAPCGCGDDFCYSFRTAPRPTETVQSFPIGGEFIGSVCLDTVDDRIVYIEVI